MAFSFFFSICSFFIAPFSTTSFPSHWFWGTIQSHPTYRYTTLWSPKPLHKLLELSTYFYYCNDMFTDFRSAINATSVPFKRPSLPRRDIKNVVCRPSNNIGAVSYTRFFQEQTTIPHQRLDFFKHSFTNSQQNSISESLADTDKLLFDPLIVGYFSGFLSFPLMQTFWNSYIFVNLYWAVSWPQLKSFTYFSNPFWSLYKPLPNTALSSFLNFMLIISLTFSINSCGFCLSYWCHVL